MRLLSCILLLCCAWSCSRQPARWDMDNSLPLLRSNLGIGDIIADSLIEINPDQSVGIRFEKDLFSFQIDSLTEISPDTITREFSIAPLASFTLNPGQTFFQSSDEFTFGSLETRLSEARIKNGTLRFRAINTIASPLNFVLTVPGATLEGVPLTVSTTVPPAADGQNGELILNLPLEDYVLNLGGTDGYGYNTLSVNFRLILPPDGDAVTVFNTDFVQLDLTYSNLNIAFAKGYLGSWSDLVNQSTSFDDFRKFNSALLDLETAEATLTFFNSFGVDIQADIFQIKAWNTHTNTGLSLQSPFIGSTLNLSRGDLSGDRILPFEKSFDLSPTNSNLVALLELLPDSVKFQAHIAVNPFGNISNFNDFITTDSELRANLKAYIPLRFSLSNISLLDTVVIAHTPQPGFEVQNGELFLYAENGFPADIRLSLTALSADRLPLLQLNNYLDSTSTEASTDIRLIAGRTDTIPAKSLLRYRLNEAATDILKRASSIAIIADFETANYPERVTFQAADSLKILISTHFSSTVNL